MKQVVGRSGFESYNDSLVSNRQCGESVEKTTRVLSIFFNKRMCLEILGLNFIHGVIFKITHVKAWFPIQMFHNGIDELSIWKELQTLDEPELKTQINC